MHFFRTSFNTFNNQEQNGASSTMKVGLSHIILLILFRVLRQKEFWWMNEWAIIRGEKVITHYKHTHCHILYRYAECNRCAFFVKSRRFGTEWINRIIDKKEFRRQRACWCEKKTAKIGRLFVIHSFNVANEISLCFVTVSPSCFLWSMKQ